LISDPPLAKRAFSGWLFALRAVDADGASMIFGAIFVNTPFLVA
jgi:hypothetical protein